jgi:mono/diheme cytochrome c family protein
VVPSDPKTASAKKPGAAVVAPSTDPHWSMLGNYCQKCHNAEDWAGGLAFDTMTSDSIGSDAETWEKAMVKLRGRLMPPPGQKQPDPQTIRSFVSWMENNLDHAATTQPDPGRVALHRLNRKEYANAVWDLLAVRVDANTILPTDDTIDGFDNVANVLQVSPSFLDQYLSAARSVAVDAVGEVPINPGGTQYIVKNAGSQLGYEDGLPLGTRGGMEVTHFFPADGEYELNIGNMAVALWVTGMNFQNHLIATLDGKKFFETNIGGEADMKSIDQKQDPAVDAINKRLKEIRFKAKAGPHKVAVTFVHRTFAESDDKLYSQVGGGGQDRVLRLANFEIKGPYNPTGISDTPSREKIFVCHPANAADEAPCAQKILEKLARDAYRRPPSPSDLKLLMAFYAKGRENGGSFDEGIRHGVTAILASPFFLYRSEPAPQNVSAGGTYKITDLELASRLSFFLWSSTPDEELLNVAASGHLRDPGVLEKQVHRMLADQRSETLASNFAYQWLGMSKLSEIDPDMNVFPYAGDPRPIYLTELKMFVDSVFRENQNVVNLLTANYTYLNERLAILYGVNDVKGDRFRRVTLTDSHRFGLLGKGAVLMVSSYPNRTAPVLRGKWVLESITGTPPAPPPPNIPQIKDPVAGETPKTMRALMEQHRKQSSCFACHGVLDPLGLALENYDAVGVWRTKDRLAGTAIDASAQMPDGTKINGVDDLRNALTANPEQFVQTLTEKLMTYGLGRTVEYRDMPTVRRIVRDAAKDNYRFDTIVMDIVNSDQFQMRSVPKDDSISHKTQQTQTQPLKIPPLAAAH